MNAMDYSFDLNPNRNGGVKRRRSDSLESLEEWPSPKKLVTEQLMDDTQRWQATGYRHRGFTTVNPPNVHRSAHFQTILNRESDENKHPALRLDHKNLTGPRAIVDRDRDQAVEPAMSDYQTEMTSETSDDGVNDEDPHPDEDIISYCHRVGYVPVDTHLPAESASIQAFLNLAPVRRLERNLLSTARPWRPNTSGYANWYALFTQLSGRVADEPCAKCTRGLARWAQCIVPSTRETMLAMNGACGCCLYNNQGSTCSFARVNRTATLASPFQPRPLVVLPQEFHPHPEPFLSATGVATTNQELRSEAGPPVRPAAIPNYDGLPNPNFPPYSSLSTNFAPRPPFSTTDCLLHRVNKNSSVPFSPYTSPQGPSFDTSTNPGYGYNAPVGNGMRGHFAATASHHPNSDGHCYYHSTPAKQEWVKTEQDERDQVMGDIVTNAAKMAELSAQQCRLLLKFQMLDKARRR